MTTNQFRQLAAYNRWANARLYAAAVDLSDQAYRLHIGVFFGTCTVSPFASCWVWQKRHLRRRRANRLTEDMMNGDDKSLIETFT
jgi:hypothetical protein